MENQIISGASFHRGKSKQDYCTPNDFREAVSKKFGTPSFDLAASLKNKFCLGDYFFDEEADALQQVWSEPEGLLWLNPPFGNIAPWAKKCSEEGGFGANILFLIPASVGSNWWAEYVHNRSFVHFLRPRICFDGKDPFPKDCALCEYGTSRIGYDLWKWK